jgi:hypothetical protein
VLCNRFIKRTEIPIFQELTIVRTNASTNHVESFASTIVGRFPECEYCSALNNVSFAIELHYLGH